MALGWESVHKTKKLAHVYIFLGYNILKSIMQIELYNNPTQRVDESRNSTNGYHLYHKALSFPKIMALWMVKTFGNILGVLVKIGYI